MTNHEPERIGRYRVLSLLGHGAMGNVFLAEDPRLKRKVAIKVVRPSADDAQDNTLERFNREAEISAQLNHPNIITVFDVGEDPAVGVFLAMEYIKGSSLASLIRDRRPGLEACMFLLVQAMRALQAAADAGIVHRDVKPENIMVSENGRLKLMDFGLARGEDNRLTATGVFMGTPSFTAPELLLGKEPGVESDRYAFAVTAFELITGELPFKGDTLGVTLYRIVHEEPSVRADLAPALAQVFRKALAKNPAERYPSLAGFMAALIQAAPLPESARLKLSGLVEAESALSEIKPVAPTAPAPAQPRATEKKPRPSDKPKPASAPPVVSIDKLLGGLKVGPRATPPAPVASPRSPVPLASVNKLLGNLLPPIKPQPAPKPARKPSPKPAPKVAVPAPPAEAVASAPPQPPAAPVEILVPPRPLEVEATQAMPAAVPFRLEDGLIDDPFAGIDWEEVLKPQELPQPTVESLYRDLEENLAGADVLAAEQVAESRDLAEEIEHFQEDLAGLDVIEAENRAEGQELVRDLEMELANSELPDLDDPR